MAVIVALPSGKLDVVNVATPEVSATVAREEPLAEKVTVPSGTAFDPVAVFCTEAVKVTESCTKLELFELDKMRLVVAGLTTSEAEAELLLLTAESPA